jgi:hypothetical protein
MFCLILAALRLARETARYVTGNIRVDTPTRRHASRSTASSPAEPGARAQSIDRDKRVCPCVSTSIWRNEIKGLQYCRCGRVAFPAIKRQFLYADGPPGPFYERARGGSPEKIDAQPGRFVSYFQRHAPKIRGGRVGVRLKSEVGA